MSKKSYKTEEVPPLKKSIIHKVEKQYGKDNPKTYATLWKIYKDKKKNEDVPGVSTADVVGTGDDADAWKRKRKRRNLRGTSMHQMLWADSFVWKVQM